MSIVEIGPKDHLSICDKVGIPPGGPSARGSTWWRRYLACPREHAILNELGWTARTLSKPLDVGIVWHYMLQLYYSHLYLRQQGKATTPELPEMQPLKLLEPLRGEPDYEESLDLLMRMYASYLREHQAYDELNWKILSVESEIMTPAGWRFPYSSRLDLVILDTKEGRIFVSEHKSASRFDDNTISGYNTDLQVIGQIWLVRNFVDIASYGHEFGGTLVNITTKQKQPGNLRVHVYPTDQQLIDWETSMAFWWSQRPAMEKAGWPQNLNSCVRRYGRCEAWDVCYSRPGAGVRDLVRLGPPNSMKGKET